MFKVLELSQLFVYLGELLRILVPKGGQKKLLSCGLLGGISVQVDTMHLFQDELNTNSN